MARHKVHERTRARKSALALLYSSDITERDADDIVDAGAYPAGDIDLPEYAEALVRGVAAHRVEIDKRLSSTSENWALDRMPVVDRAILRLATYEMVYVDEVPVSVAINEAVELAKAYGGEDDSSRFVNGVLGRIARALEAEVAGENEEAAMAEVADEAATAEVAESAEAVDVEGVAAAEGAEAVEAAAEPASADAAAEVEPAEPAESPSEEASDGE